LYFSDTEMFMIEWIWVGSSKNQLRAC